MSLFNNLNFCKKITNYLSLKQFDILKRRNCRLLKSSVTEGTVALSRNVYYGWTLNKVLFTWGLSHNFTFQLSQLKLLKKNRFTAFTIG